MPNVRRCQQLSVFLENKPGQLALLCSCLADAGVHVIALSVADNIEHGLVRCAVETSDAACGAVQSAGLNCLEAEVLAVELSNRVGSIASLADHLGRAGVNIQYLYGSHLPPEETGLMILRVLDIDKAEEALNSWEG